MAKNKAVKGKYPATRFRFPADIREILDGIVDDHNNGSVEKTNRSAVMRRLIRREGKRLGITKQA